MNLAGRGFPKEAAEDRILWKGTVEIPAQDTVLYLQSFSALPPADETQFLNVIVRGTGWRLFKSIWSVLCIASRLHGSCVILHSENMPKLII